MVEDTVRFWNDMCKNFFSQHSAVLGKYDMIIPVPLHRRRYAERGFNQSEQLAAIVSSVLNIPCATVLKRVRYTKQQARLSQSDRRQNVMSAFALKESCQTVSGKHVMLVDDVFTSGATMQECGRVLVERGAASVSGFTLARRM